MENQNNESIESTKEAFKFLTKKALKEITPEEFKKNEKGALEQYSILEKAKKNPEKTLTVKEEKLLAKLENYIKNFTVLAYVQKQEYTPLSKTKTPEKEITIDNSKNFDYLKNQIKFLGLGENEAMIKDLEKKLNSGEKDFKMILDYDKTSFKSNKASFVLNFNKSEKSENYFLNNFVARLQNEQKKVDHSHTFGIKENGFTAKQAINLLEGRNVLSTIKNSSTGKEESGFVSLKLKEPKNENGNFKLQVFSKNYGVDTAKIVDASSLKFENDKHREITIKSLEKGNIVAVKMEKDGKITDGNAVLNPQYKTLNLYDTTMQRLNTNKAVIDESLDIESKNKNTMKQSR